MTAQDTNPAGEKRTIAPLFTWRSAIADSSLTATERHCLLALSLYMNERGGSAYPGSARLAHDTGYHVDTVKRALSAAANTGWLVIVKKGGSPHGGIRHATEYVAHTPVDNDWGSTITGGPDAPDRGSCVVRPGVQDLPITSLNTSENSREVFQTDREWAEDASPPPWVAQGLSYRAWSDAGSPVEAEA